MSREELIARSRWIADKIPALGDYAKEASALLIEMADALTALQSEAGRVSVLREPTDEMWDAAWKSIGLPYRAKLSLHEIKTLFDKFHAAMLSAAPAPAATKGTGEETQADKTLLAMLYLAMRELIRRIEACGASPELTNAVTLASDMLSAIGNEWNPRDSYAAGRVHTTVIEAAKGGK